MDLLNPHIFTKDDLIQILSEKNLNINNLCNKTFRELLELYYNFIMPLHQRNLQRKDDIANGTSKNAITKLNCGSSNHRLKDKNGGDNKDFLKCNKHKRIEFSNEPSIGIGEIPKKIKTMSEIHNEAVVTKNPTKVFLKRPAENTIDSPPSKHKKITWP